MLVGTTLAPVGTAFLSYSHEDARHRDTFRRFAVQLEQEGLVTVWHDGEMIAGQPWAEEIRRHLDAARVVVALLSPDFLASPWCLDELGRTFERRDRRLVDVVPVVVRPCEWRKTPLGAIQALPAAGAPVETWVDPGAAWKDVIDGLRRVLRGERVEPAVPSREHLVQRCSDLLEADRRLMLLAPWRAGLDELAHEVARRTHGDAVTTLQLPAYEEMSAADFWAELSAEPSVESGPEFRKWLIHRGKQRYDSGRHLVVLPYFGGPRGLVKDLGHVMRGVFEQVDRFSLLVLGLARCAELLHDVHHHSLFSGIVTEHVPGMDLGETGTMLRRYGADPVHAEVVQEATGGHPEWTALSAPEVRQGRLQGLARHLADKKLFGVLRDRLMRGEHERQGNNHAAKTLERLLADDRVVQLAHARDDLTYPEVRLYYDGVLVERDERTVFRCEAAKIAAARALDQWRQRL